MVQRTAYGFAHLVPARGVVTENVLTAFALWLKEANVGAMRLRYVDPSLKALANQLAAWSRAKDSRTDRRELPDEVDATKSLQRRALRPDYHGLATYAHR
eukprot:4512984-Heterocapsa_arctica.AAC.1